MHKEEVLGFIIVSIFRLRASCAASYLSPSFCCIVLSLSCNNLVICHLDQNKQLIGNDITQPFETILRTISWTIFVYKLVFNFWTILDKISGIILGTISDIVIADRQFSGSHKGTTSRQSLGGCQADVQMS